MRAKEHLLQAQALSVKIENKKDRIRIINEKLTAPAVPELKPDKIQSSPALDRFEKLVVEKTQLEGELQDMVCEYTAFVLKTGKEIDSLDVPLYARLLHLRYIEGKSLWDISQLLEYDYGYIRHTHGEALQEYAKRYLN